MESMLNIFNPVFIKAIVIHELFSLLFSLNNTEIHKIAPFELKYYLKSIYEVLSKSKKEYTYNVNLFVRATKSINLSQNNLSYKTCHDCVNY